MVYELALPQEAMARIPKRPGVYSLWDGEICQYVGSSINLYKRIGSHPHRGKFDSAIHMEVPETELIAYEKQWIETLQPKLNKSKPCRPAKRRRITWRWSVKQQRWRLMNSGEAFHYNGSGCIAIEKYNRKVHHYGEQFRSLKRPK